MSRSLRFLLDTNVVSGPMKAAPDSRVIAALERHRAACAVAAPTLAELCFGFARLPPGRRRDRLGAWPAGVADRLPVLPFDRRAAWWLGVERARLAQAGVGVSHVDSEIAAIAACHELTVVTHNRRDFEIFEETALPLRLIPLGGSDWSSA